MDVGRHSSAWEPIGAATFPRFCRVWTRPSRSKRRMGTARKKDVETDRQERPWHARQTHPHRLDATTCRPCCARTARGPRPPRARVTVVRTWKPGSWTIRRRPVRKPRARVTCLGTARARPSCACPPRRLSHAMDAHPTRGKHCEASRPLAKRPVPLHPRPGSAPPTCGPAAVGIVALGKRPFAARTTRGGTPPNPTPGGAERSPNRTRTSITCWCPTSPSPCCSCPEWRKRTDVLVRCWPSPRQVQGRPWTMQVWNTKSWT